MDRDIPLPSARQCLQQMYTRKERESSYNRSMRRQLDRLSYMDEYGDSSCHFAIASNPNTSDLDEPLTDRLFDYRAGVPYQHDPNAYLMSPCVQERDAQDESQVMASHPSSANQTKHDRGEQHTQNPDVAPPFTQPEVRQDVQNDQAGQHDKGRKAATCGSISDSGGVEGDFYTRSGPIIHHLTVNGPTFFFPEGMKSFDCHVSWTRGAKDEVYTFQTAGESQEEEEQQGVQEQEASVDGNVVEEEDCHVDAGIIEE